MESLEQWRQGGRSFSHRNHSVFYRDGGEGAALLCLHGFPTASFDFVRIWDGLCSDLRTIAPDFLGFGFSDKPKDYRYSILDQADLAQALMLHLGLDRCHLLAHDYGVSVAQELLARHLEGGAQGEGLKLLSVCFLNGGLFPEAHRPRAIQRILAGPLGGIASRFIGPRSFGRSLAAVFASETRPQPLEMRDFWRLASRQDGTRLVHKLLDYMRERRIHRERWVGALQRSTIPLRLINGPLDPVSGRESAMRYQQIVPTPDVALLEGIGHYPHFEAPHRTLKAWREFQARFEAESAHPGRQTCR